MMMVLMMMIVLLLLLLEPTGSILAHRLPFRIILLAFFSTFVLVLIILVLLIILIRILVVMRGRLVRMGRKTRGSEVHVGEHTIAITLGEEDGRDDECLSSFTLAFGPFFG